MKSFLSTLGVIALAAVVLAFFGPGASTMASGQGDPPEGEKTECWAALSPEKIEAGSESVDVEAEFPKFLGVVTAVNAEEYSGIEVAEVAAGEAGTLMFKVDTSAAEIGSWSLIFHGEAGVCNATITIEGTPA